VPKARPFGQNKWGTHDYAMPRVWSGNYGKGRVMKKKSKKLLVASLKPTPHTAAELHEMACSLVHRGLASKAIIETRFEKPQFSRGNRHGNHQALERS